MNYLLIFSTAILNKIVAVEPPLRTVTNNDTKENTGAGGPDLDPDTDTAKTEGLEASRRNELADKLAKMQSVDKKKIPKAVEKFVNELKEALKDDPRFNTDDVEYTYDEDGDIFIHTPGSGRLLLNIQMPEFGWDKLKYIFKKGNHWSKKVLVDLCYIENKDGYVTGMEQAYNWIKFDTLQDAIKYILEGDFSEHTTWRDKYTWKEQLEMRRKAAEADQK